MYAEMGKAFGETALEANEQVNTHDFKRVHLATNVCVSSVADRLQTPTKKKLNMLDNLLIKTPEQVHDVPVLPKDFVRAAIKDRIRRSSVWASLTRASWSCWRTTRATPTGGPTRMIGPYI